MARLRRQVGIRTAQINLPRAESAGPAIVKTATSLATQAFEKQADKRTQEAQIAAAALNFERDSDGNLTAPTLPIGENGQLAPSLYDRAFTNMVGQRYIQQIKLDTGSRLNEIANQHILDPSGFQKVAEAYVQKVTDLAPDILKPDVNITAQTAMVEIHNRISRALAEKEWDDSRNIQLLTIDNIEDDVMSYALGGDDDAVLQNIIQMETNLLQGQGPNFWGDAFVTARNQALNDNLISSYIMGNITRLPNDEVVMGEAIEQLQNFADGKDKVKGFKNGEIKMIDAVEAIPSPEKRAIVAANGIKAIKARKANFLNTEDARHQRQFDNFLAAFMQKAVKAEFVGERVDRDWLLDWFFQANDTDNEALKARIRAELQTAFPIGAKPTEYELNYLAQAEDMVERTFASQDRYAKEKGVDRFELLPIEVQDDFNKSLPAQIGVFALPQTIAGARLADRVYENMAPTLRWHSEDQGGTPANQINEFIRTDMQMLGLIPLSAINYFDATLGNIEQGGSNEVMRMLSFFDAMRDTPNVRSKLKTALGDTNFTALAFMQDHMMPSQMTDSNVLRDVVERASKNQLFDPVRVLNKENQALIEESIRSSLASANDPWNKWQGAAIPSALIQETIDKIPGQAHLLGIDPSSKQLKAVGESIVEELLTSPDSRWRRDPLGMNADKARGFGMHGPDFFSGTALGGLLSQQPSAGISEYPPTYWAEKWATNHPATASGIVNDAITPALQNDLNKIDSSVPLHAGKNVHVVYSAGESILAQEPAFEMYITTDRDPVRITTNLKWDGEPVYFYPQDSVIAYKEIIRSTKEAETEIRKAQKASQPFIPFERPIRP